MLYIIVIVIDIFSNFSLCLVVYVPMYVINMFGGIQISDSKGPDQL